jgi:hypothetical protein
MKMKAKLIIYLVALALFISCNKSGVLEQSLSLAGNNRAALEKVLARYRQNPADSLKYRAAAFLISNMAGHFSFANEMLEGYYNASDTITKYYKGKSEAEIKAALDAVSQRFPHVTSVSDLQKVKADYLIANIERAFTDWQHGGYAQHINFDEFCEYLLPYKVTENQALDSWREYLSDTLYGDLKYLPYANYSNGSAYYASEKVRQTLERFRPRHIVRTDGLPIRRMSSLWSTLKFRDCDDESIAYTAAMRAKGIPAAVDCMPLWPNRRTGHSWCTIIDNGSNNRPINGPSTFPISKVYRRTFAINPGLLELANSGETVPPQFRYLCIKDVTDEYQRTVSLSLPVWKTGNSYAYLATFDGSYWQPVAWGKTRCGKAYFEKMGRDVAYLPVICSESGTAPVAPPFILTQSGEIKSIVPDSAKRQTLKLYRKHPPLSVFTYNAQRTVGGKFQAAHKPDFSDAVTIHTIAKFGTESDEIFTNTKVKYRYWRHLSAPDGWSAMGEIYFFRNGENITRQGKIIGTPPGDPGNAKQQIGNLFDNDPVTFYDAPIPTGAWAGIDFGDPVEVSRILYAPKRDGNAVTWGDEYELSFWDKDHWASLGKKKADNICLTFDGCPTGALFLLRDLTRGVEERIFTYENGKQVWW